jgi:hypothetical protein
MSLACRALACKVSGVTNGSERRQAAERTRAAARKRLEEMAAEREPVITIRCNDPNCGKPNTKLVVQLLTEKQFHCGYCGMTTELTPDQLRAALQAAESH